MTGPDTSTGGTGPKFHRLTANAWRRVAVEAVLGLALVAAAFALGWLL